MLKKKNKGFVSELDQFLAEFNQQHPQPSDSQRKELEKHQRVAALRDQPQAENNTAKIWSGF